MHIIYKHSAHRVYPNIVDFLFSADKSLVSSSMGSDYTFFQTLDDHVTQPVLFIPETHISSLQRMVGPLFSCIFIIAVYSPLLPLPPVLSESCSRPLKSLQAMGQAGVKKKTVGKYVVGKVGWEGEGMVSAKLRQEIV